MTTPDPITPDAERIKALLGQHRLQGVSIYDLSCACGEWNNWEGPGSHHAHVAEVIARVSAERETRVTERLMQTMGCKVEMDSPEGPCCEPPASCGGHGDVWYCTQHDWHEDGNAEGVCGYAVMLARAALDQSNDKGGEG